MKLSRTKVWLAVALLAGTGCWQALACGPFFPNNLLNGGDEAVLAWPQADFTRELARLGIEPSKYSAVKNTNTYEEATTKAELAALAEALKQAQTPDADVSRLCAAHSAERQKLRDYLDGVEASERSRPTVWDDGLQNFAVGPPAIPRPPFPEITIVRGLPQEFADYFAGAAAWVKPGATNKEVAREAWRHLLLLPVAERHYESTWAAFMLGKSYEKDDPARAITYFKRVRDLCDHGFADPIGLAAASLGLEAQTQLRQGNFAEALALYEEQFATGDKTAEESLRRAASAAIHKSDPTGLSALAANPRAQRVVSAYLISHNLFSSGELAEDTNSMKKWLAAVESAGVRDAASSEKFALAAYQAGDWDETQRWIQRAPDRPSNQWLEAKLLLRVGGVEQAAAILDKLTPLMPVQPESAAPGTNFADELLVDGYNEANEFQSGISASQEALGELGVARLARREFTQALDALLRSGFWTDSAYVAERVLTVEELKSYVDHQWPAETTSPSNAVGRFVPAASIRPLLARRLARLDRLAEARDYFPTNLQRSFDALTNALAKGTNAALPDAERARALFDAAWMTETNGLEFYGTETAPDWGGTGGLYDQGGVPPGRTNALTLHASDEELRRFSESAPEPNVRYHYRFQAAALGWQASELLPDNSEETARVLCLAGSWIKYLDPKKADVFYKALVNRCRHTAIGAEADRKRWFPNLDGQGNLEPAK